MREKSVLRYLRDNPRFLRRNQSEIARMLRLAERDIIDLTGRQLETLRDENTAMRKRLLDWYKAAEHNDVVIRFLHRLATHLIKGNGKKGGTQRALRLEAKRSLGLGLSKIVDLDAGDAALAPPDRNRLDECVGALRTIAPLHSLKAIVPKGSLQSFLTIPLYKGKRLRALIVFGAKERNFFPRDAHADYAMLLGEIVATALDRER